MKLKVNEAHQVSPFFIFFILFSVQVGVGILGFQRKITKGYGSEASLSILIAGCAVIVILWMLLRLLEDHEGDLITIHHNLFGKWIGGLLTLAILTYFLSMGITVLVTYVTLVQIWMFPHISYWVLAIILCVVGYAYISGGLRSIAGISFLSVIYASPLFLVLYFPLKYAHYDNLLPLLSYEPKGIVLSSQEMVLNFEGVSLILMVYPFLKQAKKSVNWAFYSVAMTTFLYFCLYIISMVYFSTNELKHIMWPTLSLWKIVDLPFLERFEYIGITIWLFVILPNLCLTMWGASRGVKRLFSINQRIILMIMFVLIIFIGYFYNDQDKLEQWNHTQSLVSFYILFAYFPMLFVYNIIHKKIKKKRKSHAKA